MNKLAIYRNNYWNEYLEKEESFGVEHDETFNLGFDAAISLDLPVFFHDWLDEEFLSTDDACMKLQCADTSELYRYWIENIFKIE